MPYMDDSDAKWAGRDEPASDLSEIAAHRAAYDLLDFAAQLAGRRESKGSERKTD